MSGQADAPAMICILQSVLLFCKYKTMVMSETGLCLYLWKPEAFRKLTCYANHQSPVLLRV